MAVNRRVSASTQTQALNALVFSYDSVLQMPLGVLAGLKRVQRRERVPVVLTHEEVKAILEHVTGMPRLMAELMYGAGLRVGERVALIKRSSAVEVLRLSKKIFCFSFLGARGCWAQRGSHGRRQ